MSSDPSLIEAAEDFKRGGWVISLLGGAGVLARMLLSDKPHPVLFWIRRFIAGAIVGVLAYFILWGVEMDGLKKSIIMTTAGAFSPELFEYIRCKIKDLKNEKINKKINSKKPKS